MKKTLLTCFAVTLALGVSAQAPVGVWGNLIDGTTAAGDQSTDIALDSDGNVYWYGTYGTTETAPDVNYAGEFLFKGALYNAGSSYGSNYTVLKTDDKGKKLWCVYSNSGDFASNSGFCSVTSDGGLITVAKVRHTDGMTDKNITLVDATGTPYEIDWKCDRRYYRLAVTKISATGSIEWNRMIDFSTEPGPKASGNNASFWADVFNVYGGTVDDQGNIYIALNYRNPVTVARTEGDPVVLTPTNTANWTGDSQATAGDFLLLGLDNKGYYRNSLQLDGKCAASYCQKLVWNDGKLFVQGYIVGTENETLKAGNLTLSPSNIISPLVLSADSNLDVKWAKCFPGEQVAGKNALQNVGLSVIGNSLYMCGQYNLRFSDPTNADKYVTATQGTLREGFVVKFDATTGEWLAARDSRDDDWNKPSAVAKTGLTGYFQVFPDLKNPEYVYVYGYVMNAQVGVFLRQYNASTLVANLPDGQYNIITGGGVPSCQTAALNSTNGAFYASARGNKAFELMVDITTPAPSAWAVLAARFDLPYSSSVTDVISADEDAPVEYYNLQGIRVVNPTKGLYIRRQGTKTEKVVL